MPEIKTREYCQKDIKTKAVCIDPGRRMKQAYIKTRQSIEKQTASKDGSANEYAAEEYTSYAEKATDKTVYELNSYGAKAFRETPANIQKAKLEYARSQTEKKVQKNTQAAKQAESRAVRENSYKTFDETGKQQSQKEISFAQNKKAGPQIKTAASANRLS